MPWPLDDKPVNPLMNTRVGNAMANPPQPEMRNASPLDAAFMGLNALGANFGYPDIAQRTAATLPLLMGFPAMRALGAVAPGAVDASIARHLLDLYPYEPTHEAGMSAIFNGVRAAGNESAWVPAPGEVPYGNRMTGWPEAWKEAGGFSTNDWDVPLAGSSEERYLNALMAQRTRSTLTPVK